MSIFPNEIADKMKNPSGDWLSGIDFDNGIVLQVISAEPIQSKFGVEEDHYYVQEGILQPGQTFRYTFKDEEGNERRHDSHSRPLAISMEQADIEANDWVRITRTGKGTSTRYQVEKVDHEEAPDPSGIPF